MKDSLKKLLDEFPYFLNKEDTSNFYKSQSVTNNQFREVYNDLRKVYDSFHIRKRCLVWREQSQDYFYTIHFVANYPYLKSVTLYKNDTVIYTESFNYEDSVDTFNYSHEDNTLNELVDGEIPVITVSKFKIVVETYDEYEIVKGYPENDTIEDDEYDHDYTLDRIGKLNNIPRKEYLLVDESEYPNTEPPWNNQTTEDDYHYMNRILYYSLHMHDTPAPVLEVWKLYGISSTMENREKLLLKVFDIFQHSYYYDDTADGDQLFVDDWTPKPWEHKDSFCPYTQVYGQYLVVTSSTNFPVLGSKVYLTFKVVDAFGNEITGVDYTYSVFIDDVQIYDKTLSQNVDFDSSLLSQSDYSIVEVICYDENGEEVGRQSIVMKVRGCEDANWYVSTNGSDSNNGTTPSTAFRTLQKAVDSVEADANLINVLQGRYTISTPIAVEDSCTIICCDEVFLENLTSNVFFTLTQGKVLTLKGFTFRRFEFFNVDNETYINNNSDGRLEQVIVYSIDRLGLFEINNDGDLILTLPEGIVNKFRINNDGDLIVTDKTGYSITNDGDIIYER